MGLICSEVGMFYELGFFLLVLGFYLFGAWFEEQFPTGVTGNLDSDYTLEYFIGHCSTKEYDTHYNLVRTYNRHVLAEPSHCSFCCPCVRR